MNKIFNTLNKLNLRSDYWNSIYHENTTPKEFKSWGTKHSNQLKKVLSLFGFDMFDKVDKNYFYYTFFAHHPDLGWVYLSISDVRHFELTQILIRTAKDTKDYSGGSNNYLLLDSEDSFTSSLISFINSYSKQVV